jgi:hypothetical protein
MEYMRGQILHGHHGKVISRKFGRRHAPITDYQGWKRSRGPVRPGFGLHGEIILPRIPHHMYSQRNRARLLLKYALGDPTSSG